MARRSVVLRALILLILAGLVLPGPSRAWAEPSPVRTEGDCRQIAAFVPVAVDRARAYVPDGFAIPGEDAGMAFVLVTGGRCDGWTVDGRRASHLRFGLISVLAHPRENPPGLDGYDLWWHVSEPVTHARFRGLGLDARSVQGIRFASAPGVLTEPSEATVRVPWRQAPFSIEASIAVTRTPPLEFPSTHWYEGKRGRVHALHSNTDGVIAPASVHIEVRPGTVLARLLGGTVFDLPGGWLRFHHSAVTRIVDPG